MYIGAIRYHRNEFFEIADAEIVDDDNRVKIQLEQRPGKQYPLRKALPRPVRQARRWWRGVAGFEHREWHRTAPPNRKQD